jgi:hypothetical protein
MGLIRKTDRQDTMMSDIASAPSLVRKTTLGRNTQNVRADMLRAVAPVTEGIVAEPPSSFLDFIEQSSLYVILFGEHCAAATMLAEFRKAKDFHYFGVRAGKLNYSKSSTKALLKRFARTAYRGDAEKRGLAFWERTAWLLWDAYLGVENLKLRAAKISLQENMRLLKIAEKRKNRASYMKKYRSQKRRDRKACGAEGSNYAH